LAALVQTGSESVPAAHPNIDFPGEETMNVPARLACLTLIACCSVTAHAQDKTRRRVLLAGASSVLR
jgi:hypothetical protein